VEGQGIISMQWFLELSSLCWRNVRWWCDLLPCYCTTARLEVIMGVEERERMSVREREVATMGRRSNLVIWMVSVNVFQLPVQTSGDTRGNVSSVSTSPHYSNSASLPLTIVVLSWRFWLYTWPVDCHHTHNVPVTFRRIWDFVLFSFINFPPLCSVLNLQGLV
jgi:hypothetical protein